jgi:hypothetical protein
MVISLRVTGDRGDGDDDNASYADDDDADDDSTVFLPPWLSTQPFTIAGDAGVLTIPAGEDDDDDDDDDDDGDLVFLVGVKWALPLPLLPPLPPLPLPPLVLLLPLIA